MGWVVRPLHHGLGCWSSGSGASSESVDKLGNSLVTKATSFGVDHSGEKEGRRKTWASDEEVQQKNDQRHDKRGEGRRDEIL